MAHFFSYLVTESKLSLSNALLGDEQIAVFQNRNEKSDADCLKVQEYNPGLRFRALETRRDALYDRLN